MEYFSANFNGMTQVLQKEKALSDRLSQIASELFSCSAKAASMGSLNNKGYAGKIWKAYGNAGNRQVEVYRMSQGLSKVCDAYRNYEAMVLQDAAEIMTVKHGFSKGAVKKAKGMSAAYAKDAKKHQLAKKNTFGQAVYDGTIGAWKENYENGAKSLELVKKTRKDIGENWSKSIDYWLEELGLEGPALGIYKTIKNKIFDKVDGFLSLREDILGVAFHFTDLKSLKEGAVAVLGEMTGDGPLEGVDKVLDSTLDVLSPESDTMQQYQEINTKAQDAFDKGNYMEGVSLLAGGSIEALANGTMEAGSNFLGEMLDSNIKEVSTLITGEESSFVDVVNEAESLVHKYANLWHRA